jgi:hypothetical protein
VFVAFDGETEQTARFASHANEADLGHAQAEVGNAVCDVIVSRGGLSMGFTLNGLNGFHWRFHMAKSVDYYVGQVRRYQDMCGERVDWAKLTAMKSGCVYRRELGLLSQSIMISENCYWHS